MALAKITTEGTADIKINSILCVCSFCNHHERDEGTVEFNFREQKVMYLCKECKKMNSMELSPKKSTPLPRTRIS